MSSEFTMGGIHGPTGATLYLLFSLSFLKRFTNTNLLFDRSFSKAIPKGAGDNKKGLSFSGRELQNGYALRSYKLLCDAFAAGLLFFLNEFLKFIDFPSQAFNLPAWQNSTLVLFCIPSDEKGGDGGGNITKYGEGVQGKQNT
jgi:hypothetical protein